MNRFGYLGIFACYLSLLVSACDRGDSTAAAGPSGENKLLLTFSSDTSANTIKGHMAFLADDLTEGREAGSRGEALSALYIATAYQRLGLQPMGVENSYIQPVPLRSGQLELGSVRFEIEREDISEVFPNGEDIFVSGNLAKASVDVAAPVVFVGHGVNAPELGLSDYDGLDVTGKVVVALGGPIPFLPPAEAAHFGSTAVKQQMAAEAGAIGLIRLWTPANEGQVNFSLLKTFLPRPSMTWTGPTGQISDNAPDILLRATVRGSAAEVLFADAQMSANAAIEAGETGPVSGFPLETTASLMLTTRHDDSLSSANVAAFLEGSDPVLRNEVIIVTAHYDHVGLCRPLNQADQICNGALDNALGTSAMMDVARRFVQQGDKPRRSILFLAVGAEEEGLLGSDYFANFPTLEGRRIVANINMDGGLPFYDFSDVIAFGAEQSTLGNILTDAVAPMGLVVGSDPFPEQGIFTRSDQYSFVKIGVPSLFLYNGFTDTEGENSGRALWDEVLSRHYHQPSDDLSLPINYEVAAKYAEVFYRVTLEAANTDDAPQWYDDSIFGAVFAPDAQKTIRQ